MASYQPGHSHADTLNFVLNINDKPFILDSGVSTYMDNKLRKWQRSTDAHNTVVVNGLNSSQVWKSFQGNRAKVKNIYEFKKK